MSKRVLPLMTTSKNWTMHVHHGKLQLSQSEVGHHQSGHLVKDKTCPCIEESGSRVVHWRRNGDRQQPGVLHLDLAAFESSADGHHYCLFVVIVEVDRVSKLLPIFVPMPKRDAASGLAAVKEALILRNDRNLRQITGSRITRLKADGGGEFNNGIAERKVGMLKISVRRLLKEAHLHRPWWSYACRGAGHMMREEVWGRPVDWPLFGQLVGIWRGHDKKAVRSLDIEDL